MVVVESDKGEAPVRSTTKGVITQFLFKEGDDVKIGSPIFEVDSEGTGSTSAPKDGSNKEDKPKAEIVPNITKEASKTEVSEISESQVREKPKKSKKKKPEPKEEEPE